MDDINWEDALGGIDTSALAANDEFYNNGVGYWEMQRNTYRTQGLSLAQAEYVIGIQRELFAVVRNHGLDLRNIEALDALRWSDPLGAAMVGMMLQAISVITSAVSGLERPEMRSLGEPPPHRRDDGFNPPGYI